MQVRVLKPHVRWWPSWADVYPNHTLAPRIQAPVLVMHVRIGDGGWGHPLVLLLICAVKGASMAAAHPCARAGHAREYQGSERKLHP